MILTMFSCHTLRLHHHIWRRSTADLVLWKSGKECSCCVNALSRSSLPRHNIWRYRVCSRHGSSGMSLYPLCQVSIVLTSLCVDVSLPLSIKTIHPLNDFDRRTTCAAVTRLTEVVVLGLVLCFARMSLHINPSSATPLILTQYSPRTECTHCKYGSVTC